MPEKAVRHILLMEKDGSLLEAEIICTQLGDGIYRAEEIPCSDSLDFGDVFEADTQGDKLRIKNAITRSGFETRYFLIPREKRESAEVKELRDEISSLGGISSWFCGMLAYALPPHVLKDPTRQFRWRD